MSALLLAALLACQEGEGDWLDWARAIDEADLSWWPTDDIGFEISGTHLWELHAFGDEPPGLTVEDPSFRTAKHHIFHRRANDEAESPDFVHRTDLWLTMYFGEYVRHVVEGRLDRGPVSADGSHWDGRMEQWWLDVGIPEFTARTGKFSAPVGNFIPRHEAKTNPLISFPLPYDHMTSLAHANEGPGVPLRRRGLPDKKDWRAVLWREMYGYGAMAFGSGDEWEYGLAVMNQAPSSWPEEWTRDPMGFVDPNVFVHAAFKPDISTKIGASFTHGPYQKGISGFDEEDAPQTLTGLDFAWSEGDWELYAEAFYNRFRAPLIGNLGSWSYYTELRYQIEPGLFAAARFGQIYFDEFRLPSGVSRQWDTDVSRVELGGGTFFTRNLWLKLAGQQNWNHGGREPDDWLVSMQIGLSF